MGPRCATLGSLGGGEGRGCGVERGVSPRCVQTSVTATRGVGEGGGAGGRRNSGGEGEEDFNDWSVGFQTRRWRLVTLNNPATQAPRPFSVYDCNRIGCLMSDFFFSSSVCFFFFPFRRTSKAPRWPLPPPCSISVKAEPYAAETDRQYICRV